MLVLPEARLVFLANPKTATQSLRAMLGPFALREPPFDAKIHEHIGLRPFARRWRAGLVARLGGPVESFAVMRAPVARLESWYRYRMRDGVDAGKSTRGMVFDDFARAAVSADPPPAARLGCQARFLGWNGARPGVDHLFDYDRLDLCLAFLSDRLGVDLVLPRHNVSPSLADVGPCVLSDTARAAYRAGRAEEFALYAALRAAGGRISSSAR